MLVVCNGCGVVQSHCVLFALVGVLRLDCVCAHGAGDNIVEGCCRLCAVLCCGAEEQRGRAWTVGGAGSSDGVGTESTSSVSHANRLQGTTRLLAILRGLKAADMDRLLLHIRDWNTQSKHNLFAQQASRVPLPEWRRRGVGVLFPEGICACLGACDRSECLLVFLT